MDGDILLENVTLDFEIAPQIDTSCAGFLSDTCWGFPFNRPTSFVPRNYVSPTQIGCVSASPDYGDDDDDTIKSELQKVIIFNGYSEDDEFIRRQTAACHILRNDNKCI